MTKAYPNWLTLGLRLFYTTSFRTEGLWLINRRRLSHMGIPAKRAERKPKISTGRDIIRLPVIDLF